MNLAHVQVQALLNGVLEWATVRIALAIATRTIGNNGLAVAFHVVHVMELVYVLEKDLDKDDKLVAVGRRVP